MPELRKDYILDRYVIIATERGKRPEQFKSIDEPAESADDLRNCFFCPGNEHTTPPEIYRTERDAKWQIRVFDNKFSAVGTRGSPVIRTDNDFFTFADAVGKHEVIVETRDHNKQLWDLSSEEIFEVMKVYRQRTEEIKKIPNVKYVIVFKNNKRDGGTSIRHSHSQAIGYNLIPTIIKEKEEAVSKHSSCPYCRIMWIENGSYRRCFENDSVIAFTPYASVAPFEIWLFPKRHVLSLNDMNDKELYDMSDILNKVLKKLKLINAPYNFYLHYGIDKMHFHIAVVPRTTIQAGFELGTGTIINVLPPEKAAEFYRG
jgi:UDPglucose--hexose-1-phosphate uridylyltransferase